MDIQVLEHQKIYIAKNRDPIKKQITIEDANFLRLLEEKNQYQIFKWGANYLTPQHWVGIISTPKVSIEILPKITNEDNYELIRDKLIYMLKFCYDVPLRKNITARVSHGNQGFLDILVAIFLKELESQIKNGLTRTYKKQIKNLQAIKGSIDFTKHLNKNILVENKFMCKFSSLTNDTQINQVIKYTLILLNNLVREQSNKTNIKRLLPLLDGVSTREITTQEIDSIQFDRNTSRYKGIIEYCKLFIEGNSLQLSSGQVNVNLMLFDMNKLFEKFIFNSYNKVFNGKVSYQYSRNYLLKSVSLDKKRVLLKPDILIRMSDTEKIVMDTKWKNTNDFADEKDLYQMNAYLTVIPDINEGILLYPKSSKNDRMVGNYVYLNQDRQINLKLRTVDLMLTGDDPAFFNYLRELLD